MMQSLTDNDVKLKQKYRRPNLHDKLNAATATFNHYQAQVQEYEEYGSSFRAWWFRFLRRRAADRCVSILEAIEAERII